MPYSPDVIGTDRQPPANRCDRSPHASHVSPEIRARILLRISATVRARATVRQSAACQRASRPPFDRAAGFRQAVATVCRARFRPVSNSGEHRNAAPDSPASPVPIPATVRAVRFRSIASRARFRFAARPPPSPETRRKRPPLRPPAPDGFAPVPPRRALASPFQAGSERRHHRPRRKRPACQRFARGDRGDRVPEASAPVSGSTVPPFDRVPPEASTVRPCDRAAKENAASHIGTRRN